MTKILNYSFYLLIYMGFKLCISILKETHIPRVLKEKCEGEYLDTKTKLAAVM
jgi:hypothetical protein